MTVLPRDETLPKEKTLTRARVRVTTGSRLHFGLLDIRRPFGGIGVMLCDPVTEVHVSPADRFGCPDGDWDRIEPIARRLMDHVGADQLPACRVQVVRRAPQHCGLGSGSQLSLAVAEALCRFLELTVHSRHLATQIAGRGQRSAVGVHGYFQGGLIFEQSPEMCDLNPVQCRLELPPSWRVAVVRPKGAVPTVSGHHERAHFARLNVASGHRPETLRRIVQEEMIPSAASAQFDAFSDAVHRYNRASGELFADVQGGAYNGAVVAEAIQTLLAQGVRGVGQSSWGPGIFAWLESDEQAARFRSSLPEGLALMTITRPRTQRRTIEVDA